MNATSDPERPSSTTIIPLVCAPQAGAELGSDRGAVHKDMKRIHPWHIVAGLGTISRQELCELLAVFEDASLGKLASDRLSDLAASRRDGADLNIDGAFQRRLTRTASRLMSSAACDDLLRLRLWTAIRRAFGREPALPLSTRSANIAAADIAHDAAAATGRAMEPEEGGASTWAKAAQQLRKHARALFNRHAADFDAAVGLHAARLLAEAAREGRLNEKDKKELVEWVRKRLADLPPELKGESVERAIRLGDVSALALLASGSSLAGLSVAVELAGFGAYIAAAQASAVIPLLSGKAAVSALFVLSHPLFIIPVLLGGGYAVERGVRRSVRRRLASGLTILLALRGLADDRRGLQSCLDAFRRLDPALVARSAVADAKRYASFMLGAREQFGCSLPAAPGPAPQSLAVTVGGERADRLREALFPQASRGQAAEAFLVAGLTLGDVVYTATAINPTVVAAVDFSRAESLASIFDFGAFAQRMSDLPERASTGAESNLCGFVAEQMVATRLVEQGHQVSFPEIANNPGYDLLVDGAEFQVKCLADIGGLREHFKKYPEIPVIANGERVHDVERLEPETAAKIFFVEGYDQETAKRLTAQNIETGAALDDLNVPVFAVAVSAARNVHGWWKGTTALAALPQFAWNGRSGLG